MDWRRRLKMSRNIFEKYGILVGKFYGGYKRGTCYQITIKDKFVQLTEIEFLIFVGSMDKECNENIDC